MVRREPGPDLPIDAEEAAAAFAALAPCRRLVLAVSGGPDSMALMGLVARWRAQRPAAPDVTVATVDHGLRPAAVAEAELVLREAGRAGFAAQRLALPAPLPHRGLSAAARDARYGVLADHARAVEADAVVTAHHADDQAETVLARLLHGSGPSGLAGMRPDRRLAAGIRLLRPCLRWPKSRLVATARAMGLPFVQDPSNHDPRFERARVRAAMPRFDALGLTRRRLAVLSARAARAEEALAAAAAGAARRHRLPDAATRPGSGDAPGEGPRAAAAEVAFAADLFSEPAEIVLRVLQAHLGGATATRLERLETLAQGLAEAFAARRPLRRTAAGFVVNLGRDGVLRLSPEPPRRRGRT